MSVSFSGLASGLDTASIIEAIMEVESYPLQTMEAEKEYLEVELDTYSEFNTMLESFYDAASALDDESDLKSLEVNNQGSEYFTISTTSLTDEGSYAVEVVDLAQQQKDVSSEWIADTDTTLLSGELQIGDQTYSYDGLTLAEIIDEISEGEFGVTASIVDDGTGDGYRMMLTADNSGETIEIIGTGSITLDTTLNGHTVEGKKAHIIVDGIDYYSTSNTMTNGIQGATVTLLEESGDEGAHSVFIESDTEDVIASRLQDLVEAYNSVNTYVGTIDATDSTLATSMETIQRSLKNTLTGSTFAELGIESDWETGELSLDTDRLSEAYEEDPDGVILSLLGDDETTGAMTGLADYLSDQVDSTGGFYAVKEDSIEQQIERLDDSMESMELRLAKRQETLEAQYAAMETLLSELNTQADYLTNFFSSYNTTDS